MGKIYVETRSLGLYVRPYIQMYLYTGLDFALLTSPFVPFALRPCDQHQIHFVSKRFTVSILTRSGLTIACNWWNLPLAYWYIPTPLLGNPSTMLLLQQQEQQQQALRRLSDMQRLWSRSLCHFLLCTNNDIKVILLGFVQITILKSYFWALNK